MKNSQTTCDPERIGLFLRQQLSGEEQAALELHLDNCGDCRRRLEDAAAGDDAWSSVRDALQGQELPPDVPTPGDSAIESTTGGAAPFNHDSVLSLLAPSDDERMLGRLGMYEVAGVIGSSGMGVVLKALDPVLNRYVAIKVLAPHLGSSGAARKRFSREAQAAAAVVHDNVIEIHGVAEAGGLPYLVMPYVRGPSLQKRLDDEGPLALPEILRIGMQAAAGLAAAHAQGLVHRDVKPANILLADGIERVKLTDFGLARAADDASLTRTGIIAGTPQYMSPEQARGESIDQRSDLFSLGSVLYAICTGRAPFRAETSYGVLRRVTDEQPRPIREINPDIPAWLCRIVERLMSKQPDDRFGSAREAAELLEQCLAHVQQPTIVPLPAAVAPRSKGRRFSFSSRRLSAAIAALCALGFGWLAMLLWQATAAPDISGKWTGKVWGDVVLKSAGPGQYEGTFTRSQSVESGKLHLKWSRVERRFNGAWMEGEERRGKVSLRRADDEIRGAWTTEEGAAAPDSPRLADLMWTRGAAFTAQSAKRASAPPAAGAPAAQFPLSEEKTVPKRLRRFSGVAAGNEVILAFSADGKRIAVANGNPTRVLQRGGASRVKDNWRPTVAVLNAASGVTEFAIKLSTDEEDAVLEATPRVSHFEATALAFSPDGSLLAVGTSIGQVKLFDAHTGQFVRALDDEQAKMADEQTPENWKTLTRALGNVASLAFSPDSKQLTVCGKSFADFAERFDGVKRLGFRGTGPGRLKLWEVQSGKLLHDLVGHNDHANAVAYAPDGSLLASAGRWMEKGDFGNGVLIWNPRTGKQIHRLIRSNANAGVRAVAFSPDGKLLALGTQRFDDDDTSTGGVSLVQASSGVTQWLVSVPGWAKPLEFSPDGKFVAVLCGGKSIRLLDTVTGTMEHEIRRADSEQDVRWRDFALSPQGGVLAISMVDGKKNGRVEVWSTPGGSHAPAAKSPPKTSNAKSEPIQRFTIDAPVGVIALAEDGRIVAVANGGPDLVEQPNGASKENKDWRPSASILDAASGKTIAALQLTTPAEDAVVAATTQVPRFNVEALALSHDGNIAAVGTSIGQVKLFDARTGRVIRSLDDRQAKLADKAAPENWRSLSRALGSARSLAFSPDGGLLAVCGDSFADFSRVFDSDDGADEPAADSGRLKVWDVKTGALLHDLPGHSFARAVEFAPQGSLLASAGRWRRNDEAAGGVMLWNPRTGNRIRNIETSGQDPRSIMFSIDGKLLAIGARQTGEAGADESITGSVRVVHISTGAVKWLRAVKGEGKPVFFPTEGSVVELHDRRSLKFRREETGELLMIISAEKGDSGIRWNDVVIANQGQMLAIGGVDSDRRGTVQVWDFE